ncbi:hypothetical protein BJX68DRAFT_269490 [Aspergillus pseudodeflectus]|uniref:Uncharacterized protein n=1 Tax=Aspergillus pseudodeflectus TaxID=176178 RepID=A0ABR4JYS5_9EURO
MTPPHRLAQYAIHESLKKVTSYHLTQSDLAKLGIHREEMKLQGKSPPLFFSPYPAAVCVPDASHITDGFPPLKDDPSSDPLALAWHLYECYGNFNFPDLCAPVSETHWDVRAAWPMRDDNLPHMVVLMYTDVVAGRALLRSEIIVVLRIMHGRLRSRSTRPHTIAPILLFSVAAPHHIRVIESYYDGERLVVRVCPSYSIAKSDHKPFCYLTRWWRGSANSQPTALF